ncbi:MAG: hypothetical protein GF372_07315 [Candidatus Marinimicrobia bacterium]|nr:hypothetical protein [Candidatus Neomarinimicrobiota bacterium]
MHRKITFKLTFGLIFIFFNTILYSEPTIRQLLKRPFYITTERVDNGLIHSHYLSDAHYGQPLSIHVLKVNMDSIMVEHVVAMDQVIGQETVSAMTTRYNALAGINGGFSYSNDPRNIYHGDPRDFLVMDGQILSEPYSTRSSFGIYTDNNGFQYPVIKQIQMTSKLTFRAFDHSFLIDGINRIRRNNEIILYTPEWNFTTLTRDDGLELTIQNNRITRISINEGGAEIPSDGFVLSASGKRADSLAFIGLASNDIIHIQHQIKSLRDSKENVDVENSSYSTAGPTLMLDGEILNDHADENIPVSFDTTRHPRTAIGISKDERNLLLLVVDGRQPGYSMGMSLSEVSLFLKEIGAYHAYNLDGGGSTTMVIGDNVVNSYSDPEERPRSDAILLFPRDRTE